MTGAHQDEPGDDADADWQRRVVGRSLRSAAERSVDRGLSLVNAAATVLERAGGEDITVQDVADEAGQSVRTLYQYFESKDDLLLAVFEEAMRTYARLVRDAVADLDEPLERLAGVVLAMVRMSERSGTGLARGLARLRLRLLEAAPERVGRAQLAMVTLMRETVDAASSAGVIDVASADSATYILTALNASTITTEALGNDVGLRRPDAVSLVLVGLRGMGASVDRDWVERVDARLRLPRGPVAPRPATGGK